MQNKKLVKILAIIFFVEIVVVSSLILSEEKGLLLTSLKSSEKLNLVELKSLCFTLDDVSEGYEFVDEFNDIGDEEEAYLTRCFYYGSEPEKYADITVGLYRSMQEETTIDHVEDSRYMINYDYYNVTELSYELGEENYIAIINASDSWRNLEPGMFTLITFRVSKISCDLYWGSDDNLDYIFKLAEIIEQKIYDIIN